MSHTSPCAQIASTNHRHHLSHSLCPSLPPPPTTPCSFRRLSPDILAPLRPSAHARLTSKCIHAPFSVALDSLAPLDSLSPCLFRSHPGPCTEHISLSPPKALSSDSLSSSKCGSACALFLSFFFYTLCFPTPPTLVRSSYLQLSVRLLSSPVIISHLSSHTGSSSSARLHQFPPPPSLFISSGVTLSIPP